MVRRASFDPNAGSDLVDEVRALRRPLHSSSDLDPLLERIGKARVVLLGEASHGTHEFYAWRAAITKRLIEEKGFNFVAVEGDWPDCYKVNRYVKSYPGSADAAEQALSAFRRWPTWMWANREARELASWMEWYNDGRPDDLKVGFYGLDLYSLWDSLRAVMRYLREKNDLVSLAAARNALQCFEAFGEDAQEYARGLTFVPHTCRDEVALMLRQLRSQIPSAEGDGRDAFFVAEQNALVVNNAETYYRNMLRSDSESWNVRDRHMAETLDRLLAFTDPAARAVVWAHNTHIGDARHTEMAEFGEVNLGQLARERYGDKDAVLVGFGTYEGQVIAGSEWGAPWTEMTAPPARSGSWDEVLHRAGGGEDSLLIFPKEPSPVLASTRGQRAIGVVYRPRFEIYGNYIETVLPKRYDAFLYIDRTTAVRPLFPAVSDLQAEEELAETYPTGV